MVESKAYNQAILPNSVKYKRHPAFKNRVKVNETFLILRKG